MEPQDVAFERFQALVAEVSGYINSVDTEQDTRLKVIDRILVDVLHWPYAAIKTEPHTDSGYVDYALSVNGRTRLIVEAKKDGKSLGSEPRQSGRAYKLNGGAIASSPAKDGIDQAIRYCNEKGAELACLTNGREFVIFRANRLADGIDVREGMAFVFNKLPDIVENFGQFYGLLAYESVSELAFRAHFQQAEGHPIRTTIHNKPLRRPGSEELIESGELTAGIEMVMASFFKRLAGDEDPELLKACFVETSESEQADRKLTRLAKGLVKQVQALDTGQAGKLTQLVRRVRTSNQREFVLLVGAKGSGKSTFIQRFFADVLPRDIADSCVVLRVDVGNFGSSQEELTQWLDLALIEYAEQSLNSGAPSYDDIRGMFFGEYTRLSKGPWKPLYDVDKTQFQINFGQHVENIRTNQPNKYVRGIIRQIARSRKKLPVVVFDNVDQFSIEFQQTAYQYARSIYEDSICLVVVPITDRTSWQLSKYGSLQSFENVSFALPTPETSQIIRKRIEFIEGKIEETQQKPDDRYFVKRGISLSLADIEGFTRTIQRVFTQSSNVARWVGMLANYDVRRTLTLVSTIVTSPHLDVEDLLKAYIGGSTRSVSPANVVRAIVRGDYDIYPAGHHDFVQNVFAAHNELESSPLLCLRILQLLSDVPEREHVGALIDTDEAIFYCTSMDIDPQATQLTLDAMLKTGLLLSYDPTVEDISSAGKIEISPAGRLHLQWGMADNEYLAAMADVTPVLSQMTLEQMRDDIKVKGGRRRKSATFLEYLIAEDTSYCRVPAHENFVAQKRLKTALETRLASFTQ